MKTRDRNAGQSIINLKLPPRATRELGKMGLTEEWRKLKRASRGDSPLLREMQRLFPPTKKVSAVFRSVSPSLNPKLFGSAIARFWDSLYFALLLTENIQEMTRIKGRTRRRDLKLLLEVIRECALAGQRRQVEGLLRRDIPRLLMQLEPRNAHGANRPGRRRTHHDSDG